jgi:hypothetical protein
LITIVVRRQPILCDHRYAPDECHLSPLFYAFFAQ